MNSNPMQSYRREMQATREFRKGKPAILTSKIEALKVLAKLILFEVSALEENRETSMPVEVDLAQEMQRFEEELIRSALTKSGGRQRRAAELLGVKPTTLHAKMKRFGMINDPDRIEQNGNIEKI